MDPDSILEFMIADVVRSTAGHDAGKLFYVIGTDDGYLLLANGKDRSLEQPKRKKRKHAQKVLRSETRVAEKLRTGLLLYLRQGGFPYAAHDFQLARDVRP